ncbi:MULTISPECIES: M24 family metallopeptidase [Lacticaseibacillus]|uniref:Peptidase M24 n=2 Tax=Lacticaseibacillus TaxID=2759736 RepID=A0AAN1C6I1_LACCA|nr:MULTISPECIES: Xaa-Pro peptidase family protein [Lacticaseibacillus]ARY90504.1 peptidase M24 [Lacticaseibacillus casei]KAB1970362.1 aminopeptidase P family protein [Lacticaseibacillus casei]WLV81124.1 Xaa-Pro peptidase family protein [Lacticaseibacillus sp. NCIMB 15473]WNX25084.1 Xaa-Pro peptidase family protein [Lacticaseibacillus casei]WNX27855.1 Xaa-Pro peptidase family protein [Lacticaseibacillus casei]
MNHLTKLQEALEAEALDALLLHDRPSKRYVGALPGSGVYVIVTPTQALQLHDGRYRTEAADTQGFTNVEVPQGSYLPQLIDCLKTQGSQRIGLVSSGFSIAEYQALASQKLATTLADDLVARQRAVKDEAEIAAVTAACSVTDTIFAQLLPHIRPGVSEQILSAWLHFYTLEAGASAMAFDPIVASGPRGAFPHGRPTARRLQENELVTVDFGVVFDDYQSDMTRTLAIGSPAPELAAVHEAVLTAQQTAIAAIKPGMQGREVDAIARGVLTAAGYGDCFTHGLGHGLGLGGDQPILNPRSQTILQPGMIVTVEPGAYLPGIGGVRIEDDVMITATGARVLNQTPRHLTQLEVVENEPA